MSESQSRIRVAIVDAQVLVAAGLGALLERAGLSVVAAVPGWTELLEHPDLPVDVVVLDLDPRDGVLIGSKVRELTARGIRTVVVSRRTDAASVAAAMRAGARAFVATSDSADDLVSAIRTAANGGQHLAESRLDAVRAVIGAPEAGLGRQEERAIVLYAAGRSLREVAAAMSTTEETVKSYIKRARRKYSKLGVNLGTRERLRAFAADQGWTAPD